VLAAARVLSNPSFPASLAERVARRCVYSNPPLPLLTLLAGKKRHETFDLQARKDADNELTDEEEARLAAYLAIQSAAG